MESGTALEHLKSLYELIGRMNSMYDLPELLAFVVRRMLHISQAQRGFLFLSHNHKISEPLVIITQSDALSKAEPVSQAVINEVMHIKQPRRIANLSTHAPTDGFTGAVLAVPLAINTTFIGLIYLDHQAVDAFHDADLDLLVAFANQAALAIHRTREHERQVDELALLNELSRSLVRVLDLDEVLTRIIEQATHILNVQTGSVLLLDKHTSELYFATSIYENRQVDIPIRLVPNQGLAGWVLKTGQPIFVNNVTQDGRWFGEVDQNFKTQSLLAVPLTSNGKPQGVLQVLNKKSDRGFNDADTELLAAFAASATIAIENAQLFREAQRVQHLELLNKAALALGSTLDLDSVLNISLEQTCCLLSASGGLLQLHYSDSHAFINRNVEPETHTLLYPLFDLPLCVEVTDPLFIDTSQPHPPPVDTAQLTRAGVYNVALVPLCIDTHTNGALMLTNYHSNTPLLSSLVHIIRLAIQNALYHNQVQQQAAHLEYLNKVGSLLTSSLSLSKVIALLVDGVNTLLNTSDASFFLVDPATGQLCLEYSTQRDNLRPNPVVEKAVAQGHTLLTSAAGQASGLCVPLHVDDNVIGVIEVWSTSGGQQFNHHHQALIEDLGQWAAIAVHNARLYTERGEAYQRLHTEQQRRINAESWLATAAVVLDLAHTMNNVVGAIRVWATTLERAAASPNAPSLARYQTQVRQIRQNAEEAIKLVRSATEPLRRSVTVPTDVRACLKSALQNVSYPAHITIIADYDPDLPLVQAQPNRLETVFYNLLMNAVQALGDQPGQITVKTRYQWTVDISISDTGPGIPPEQQEQIFQPGLSSHADGLGIGLWLVEIFVNQFNGYIHLSSTPGQGATFTISLLPAET